MKITFRLLGAAIFLGLTTLPARTEEAKARAAGKMAFAKYQDAVVTVKLILKEKGRKVEMPTEISGTVLSADGLTVMSDFSTNPSGLLAGEGAGTETTDVKLLLKNGREVPAKFVLRDKDLDLAFVMPKEESLKLTHVKLETGPVPGVLDDLVFIYRMGKAMNRDAAVVLGRVEAVVKKPRTFVVPELLTGLQSLGCPVFDDSGRPIGVVVVRRSATGLKDIGGLRDVLEMLKPVILMAEDIQDAASQVSKPKDAPK